MKVFFARPHGEQASGDGGVEPVTLRYNAAFDVYQEIVDRNTSLMLSGSKPSALAYLEEERAFEELDGARYALLTAAALAYPTVH
jgi:hypothetical protein